MKQKHTYLYIAISSAALLVVLIIQVSWIFRTAKIKEELFNDKANMVLSRTTEALRSDKETCMKIGACAEMDSTYETVAKLGESEAQKIDSLFRYYMKFYNFHIDYTFVVLKQGSRAFNNGSGFTNDSYNKPLTEVTSKNGLELKLIFPEKKQFIIAEMGSLFITSVILILVVFFMFLRTILSLMKEQRLSEHTSDFLNTMTHEFKTPLTNIALAGKMILKETGIKREAEILHYSEIILEENEKLRLRIEQVLDMTALERGEIPIRKTEIDLHELIRDSARSLNIQVEDKQGTLKLDLNSARYMLMGDKTHLTSIFCNLIDNAIKYSGNKPDIFIQTSTCGQNITITVSDNGFGIEKQYQKQVFDKYFRVPTGDLHDVKGFGLGLTYIRKIVELHGGTIELKSDKGKGATFIIALPFD